MPSVGNWTACSSRRIDSGGLFVGESLVWSRLEGDDVFLIPGILGSLIINILVIIMRKTIIDGLR